MRLGLTWPVPAVQPAEDDYVELKPRWPLGPRDPRGVPATRPRSEKTRGLAEDLSSFTRAELARVQMQGRQQETASS